VIKYIKIKQKSYAVLKLSVICMAHLVGILIAFTYCWRSSDFLWQHKS